MPDDVPDIVARFSVAGQIQTCEAFSGGHIHDSYLVAASDQDRTARFLLQRINNTVFEAPAKLMENIQRVIEHAANVVRSQCIRELDRRVLSLVPTRQDQPYLCTSSGDCWRMYRYIEDTQVHRDAETAQLAFEAARAFGNFQGMLRELPGAPLHETIPGFHNTPLRFARFQQSVEADLCERVAAARNEINAALNRKELAGVLASLQARGELPIRTVHNDAKISNVLFDRFTHDVLCVVDLDTVMLGLSLHDFGDMVRSMATRTGEEETDLSLVHVDLELFEALATGFLEATCEFLTPSERQHLLTAGQVITLEQAVRFLTDFLRGDPYYKTNHPQHNLDRCRNQFRLLESLERQAGKMKRFTEGQR